MRSRLANEKTNRALLAGIAVAVFIVAVFSVALKHTAIAEFLWSNGRFSGAATILNPQSAELWLKMGNYHFGGSAPHYNIERAQAMFQKAILLDPRLPSAHYQLARVYFIKGDFYSAITEINKEISMYPDFAKSYYVKGLIDGYSGNLGSAVA
ncbi:MAG: hypothetical protein AAB869_02755, partial [Patescibacteria group bacterium]